MNNVYKNNFIKYKFKYLELKEMSAGMKKTLNDTSSKKEININKAELDSILRE